MWSPMFFQEVWATAGHGELCFVFVCVDVRLLISVYVDCLDTVVHPRRPSTPPLRLAATEEAKSHLDCGIHSHTKCGPGAIWKTTRFAPS